MDPLSVLRDYTIRADLDSIRAVGEDFLFGDDYRFPCNIDTAYRSKQGSLYTLESLVFFVKNSLLKHTEYMQQARIQKLQIVTYTDRKPLLDYLEGKVNTTDAIELVAPAGPHIPPTRDHWDGDDVEEYRPEDPSLGLYNNANNSNKRMRPDGDGDNNNIEIDERVTEPVPRTELIRNRERPLKDRESLLECPNRNFQNILSMATKRDEERKKAEEQQRKDSDRPSETPRKNHFASVEEKRFWKDHLGTDTDELGIDPTQSYIGANKQKDSVMAKGDVRSQRPQIQSSSAHAHHRPSAPLGGGTPHHKGKLEGVPLILVPSAFQTLLNIYNAKDFLEDGIYVAADVKAKSTPKKPECVTIQRKIGREKAPVTYEIRDKPSALAPKDWDRVAAVFVLGKEWQFKDWPFKDHVEIFNKIMGFYLRFEDDSLESAKVVKQWNVKIISISKHKRHQDKTAALEFWDRLDDFLRSERPNLFF